MMDSSAKAVIEAALFAAGRTLTPRELAEISGLSPEMAEEAVRELAREYAGRSSGIEIKSIGEGYVKELEKRGIRSHSATIMKSSL